MEEGLEALRTLWAQERASYEGEYIKSTDVVSRPRPVTKPHPPIWITTNPRHTRQTAEKHLTSNIDVPVVQRMIRRVTRLPDGRMPTMLNPQEFAEWWQAILEAREQEGKDTASFDNSLYFNSNINDDREAADADTKSYLDAMYGRDWPKEAVDTWVAYGAARRRSSKGSRASWRWV